MTFNRLANIQYSRLKNKVLTDPLEEPTIPIIATAFQPITEEDYLVLGEFLDTDLLNGEIAINTASDRVWVRSDDSILELSVAGSASSLTGGNGISIGTSSTIDLGGTLNQPTILLGNSQTFDLGTTASPLSFLRIEGIQSTENYKFGGEGLSLIKNPGTYFSDMDYTASLDRRSFTEQSVSTISSVVNTNSTYEQTQITQTPHEINILVRVNGADDSGFVLNQFTDNFSFVDKRLTPKGLEYSDDYSANFSVRSLVDKEYVDNNISGLSFSLINDLTPQLGGNLDLNNFNIGGTGSIDIEGNVIADMIQLKGGVGTQGEMSWNVDEETIQLVMDGVTQHIGQDTYIHARNNTASTILKGTPVRATGTLGGSGRITISPMIADGSIPGRYFIGLSAEDITAGSDGQVITFGKIRQIDLSDFNDGDVLWLDPTIAGLTSSIPQAPDLKIATAFVIHASNNGSLFVRVENGTDLHNDQRVEVSGLTNNDVLTWNNTNQRWQNAQVSAPNFANTNLTLTGNRSHELNGNSFQLRGVNYGGLQPHTFGYDNTTDSFYFTKMGSGVNQSLDNQNLILGYKSASGGTNFSFNNSVIIGTEAGRDLSTGTNTRGSNTLIGTRAGKLLNGTAGSSSISNVMIGSQAGENLTNANSNIILGTYNETKQGFTQNTIISNGSVSLTNGTSRSIVIGRQINESGATNDRVFLGGDNIIDTILRGSVQMPTKTTSPAILKNNFYTIWFDSGVPTLRLKNNLGVESNIPLQSTTSAITKTSGVFNRTLTLEAPTATENITIFRTDVAITIQEVIAVSTGTSPSTTYQIKHSTDRSAAGNNLTTSGTTTSTTTGNVATLSVASVPADSWVWLETTAATGTSVKLSIDIRYTID